MKWNRITGWSGVSYYSGRIGDSNCRWIHQGDCGKWYVSRGISFDGLDDAMSWFTIDSPLVGDV